MADDQAEENIHIEETDGGEELLTVGDEPRRTRGSLRWWASITALVGLVIGAGFLAGSLLGDDDGDASPDSDSADVETAGNDEAAADDGAADSTPSPDQAPGEATVQGAVANSSVSAVEGTGFTSFDHCRSSPRRWQLSSRTKCAKSSRAPVPPRSRMPRPP